MKLSEFKEDYYSFTGKLSDINRQMAFAAIAIVWIFKQGEGNNVSIEQSLIFPSILVVLALGVDMLQYIYQSIVWAIFYSYHKKKGLNEDTEIKSPVKLNIASWILFGAKILLVIIAYWNICIFLIHKFIDTI